MSCDFVLSNLTDKYYLNYLIKCYTNTIKLSNLSYSLTNEDFILDYSRKIISKHNIELVELQNLLKSIPNIQSIKIESKYNGYENNIVLNNYEKTIEKFTEESIPIVNSEINDVLNSSNFEQKYIDSILNYYKCAVNLSKEIIKITLEPKILQIANIFIISKNKEIFMLENLHQCYQNYWRTNLNL